nr:Cingulin like [Ipomoea batatas]
MNRHRVQLLSPPPPLQSPTSSPCMAALRSKFSRIASQHEQLKIAFNHLNFQIRTGLHEAEDVFASLAIPLMKLVGLKTVEMAEEGKFSTIIIDNSSSYAQRNEIGSETVARSDGAYKIPNTGKFEEENYTAKAITVGKELMLKQKMQLMQLVHLLRQVEAQVKSSHNDILLTFNDNRASIQKIFQKAVACVSAVHEENNGTSFLVLNLLKYIFEHVGAALGSVLHGVEVFMHDLTSNMCNPMVEYAKGLKAEVTSGSCLRLLATVEEMGGVMRTRRLELEEARKKMRLACLEDCQGKDEKLLWELLKKKRKYKAPMSPLGAVGIFDMGSSGRNLKSMRVRPSIHTRRTSEMLSP